VVIENAQQWPYNRKQVEIVVPVLDVTIDCYHKLGVNLQVRAPNISTVDEMRERQLLFALAVNLRNTNAMQATFVITKHSSLHTS